MGGDLYIMRELRNEDMYIISEIIDKIGFEMPSMYEIVDDINENGEIIKKRMKMDDETFGSKMIIQLVKKMHLAKNEINQLLANVNEVDISEIEKKPLFILIKEIKELFNKNKKELIDFFSLA